tara:strand:+ start:902 stop:1450 length:549 start_codon:yes stop_codon:yes gene_type:complete
MKNARNHTKDEIINLPKKIWKNKKNKNLYQQKQAEDLFYGEIGELETLPILIKYFGYKIKKLDRYNSFDFVSEDGKNYFEVKTRRNDKFKYPSTIVPTSKIVKAKKYNKKGKNVYFVFNFTDVISIVKFSNDKSEFKHKIATGGRWDRNKDETKSYTFIFVSCLEDITHREPEFLSDSDDEY